MSAARRNTFLGARYKRIVKRRGHRRALVAVARSILVIIWHLINDPDTQFRDLGSDYHQRLIDPGRRTHDLVRQLRPSATTSPSVPQQPDQHTPPVLAKERGSLPWNWGIFRSGTYGQPVTPAVPPPEGHWGAYTYTGPWKLEDRAARDPATPRVRHRPCSYATGCANPAPCWPPPSPSPGRPLPGSPGKRPKPRRCPPRCRRRQCWRAYARERLPAYP